VPERQGGAHAGDVLTAWRVVATPLFAWSFAHAVERAQSGWLPALLFTSVSASDFFDGRLARRAGRASARGRAADSLADIVFLLTALIAAYTEALIPWWVPAAIAASFGFYFVDSWILTRHAPQRTLIASRIGHWGGVANYVLVGVLTFNNACGLHLLGAQFLLALCGLVPIYSSAAILARLRGRL
jgi:phosphatidylglycerophosphate synthase